MKKVIVVILFICLFFNSCGYHHEVQGLENFDVNESDVELCQGLIPDNFIETFTYKNGNYFFSTSEKAPAFAVCERVFLYLQYDDDVYLKAKQYAMEELVLSDDIVIQYNDYMFYDNNVNSNRFPYRFIEYGAPA